MLAFLLVWFGVNALMGLGSFALPGMEHAIAWQAHIGGFAVGLLAFALFDPVPPARASDGTTTIRNHPARRMISHARTRGCDAATPCGSGRSG